MPYATIEEIDPAVAGQTVPAPFLDTVAATATWSPCGRWPASSRGPGTSGPSQSTPTTWPGRRRPAAARRGAGRPGAADDAQPARLPLARRRRPVPAGHAGVSIYNSSSPEEVAYLAGHAEAKSRSSRTPVPREVPEGATRAPDARDIFVIHRPSCRPRACSPPPSCSSRGDADLDALAAATEPSDLATLIYTSGTTGPPKGVMLDQYNVVYTAEQLSRVHRARRAAGRRLVSYLPMAHIAERMTSHYQEMLHGYTVTTCPDPTQIATYAREVHPELIFGVPRVWEKVYAGVNAALAARPRARSRSSTRASPRRSRSRPPSGPARPPRSSSTRGRSSTPSPSRRSAASSGSTRSWPPSPAPRRSAARSSSGSTPSACRCRRSTA